MNFSKKEFLSFFEIHEEDISHYYIFPLLDIEGETTMSLMNQLYSKLSTNYKKTKEIVFEEYVSTMNEQNDMSGDMFVDMRYVEFLASLTRVIRSN